MSASSSPVPELLPGEPDRRPPTGIRFAAGLAVRAVGVSLLLALTLPLWPVLALASLVWGWPPNVPRAAQIARYLRLTWTARPPPPGLGLGARLVLTANILRKVATVPVWGLAWLLDEALYGRQLDATPLVAPLIEISAGRSGSTQLARYLEDDPQLAAPSLIQSMFPYLWLWRLARAVLGGRVSREAIQRRIEAMLPPEFLERHEADPLRTDTFDGVLYLAHLNGMAGSLGPDAMIDEFHFARPAPHNRGLWDELFPAMLERIGRKTLLFAGPAPGGGPRRFFVKGHFLAAMPALARRLPDARFLTMIRDPGPRLQSAINYLRANPSDPLLGPVPWAWLGQALAVTEAEYCEIERDLFTRADGPRRTVLRFDAYTRDLEGAMRRVYRECLDQPEPPAGVARAHAARRRGAYLLNRSLEQAGVDGEALNTRLVGYRAWCEGR